MSERTALGLLCSVLVLGGGLAWWLQLQPPLVVDISPLETLPLSVDEWSSVNLVLEDRVADELAADFNLQRAYRHPTGQLIWLYVGYYSTERGGRPEHTPRGCYTGAGWEIKEASIVDVPNGQVQEFVVQRGGEHRLVHFWFRSHRRGGMQGGSDLGFDRVIGKLTTGRADGALIRISTPILDASEAHAARSRLAAFRSGFVPQLEQRWPQEHAPGSASRMAKDAADRAEINTDAQPSGKEREHSPHRGVEFRITHHLRAWSGHTPAGWTSTH